MNLTVGVRALRVYLGCGLVAALALLVVGLPRLSGAMASDYPEVADMRWPVLAICELGVLAVMAIGVAVWRLLDAVRDGHIFTAASVRWASVVAGCLGVLVVLALALLGYDLSRSVGPASVPATFLLAAVGALGCLLLMLVLRALLVRAIELQTDADGVI